MHFHVIRHNEDEDPYVTTDTVSAFSYAAQEIDRIADHEHSWALGAFVQEWWRDSAIAYHNSETYANVVANLQNVVRNAALSPDDRAPIYRDESQCGPLWTKSMEWTLDVVMRDAPKDFRFYRCGLPDAQCVPGAWILWHGGDFVSDRELSRPLSNPDNALRVMQEAMTTWADAEEEDTDAAHVRGVFSDLHADPNRLTREGSLRETIHADDGATYWWELRWTEQQPE